MALKSHLIASPLALAALLGAAVTGLVRDDRRAALPVSHAPAAAAIASSAASATEVADLSEIRFRREFRILVPARVPGADRHTLHGGAHPRDVKLMEKFAEEQFLIPVWVAVQRWESLVPSLLAGEGDMVAAHLRIPEYRARGVDHSVPVEDVRETLVVRQGDAITEPEHLRGREIALRARSSFWPVLRQLQSRVDDIRARIIPDHLPPETVLQRVLSFEYDAAVLDVSTMRIGEERWAGLRAMAPYASSDSLAFGVHPSAVELKLALDDFLTREQLRRPEMQRYSDDLPGIKRRGVLRVLTRNNAATYFLWRGLPLGFEYELMAKFAREQNLSLEMVVPRGRDELLPALRAGQGDVVAASLAITDERRGRGVEFTRSYKENHELFVSRSDEPQLVGPADLAGRTVTVRRSGPVWRALEQLRAGGVDFRLEAAPEDLETEEIIDRVASGLYDLTVADAYSVKVALTWREDIRAGFVLNGPTPVGWAVRRGNPRLREALNAFIEREFKGTFYNIIHARYFENPRRIRAHVAQRADRKLGAGRLSPYDDIVRRHAQHHGFDWPLIVAMIFRESRFDPQVVSWAGARGLMQVLPVTAKRFGIYNLDEPEGSIDAGVRMLAWLFEQLESDLSIKDRIWFALAAYNAGLGHLFDARRLAKELGLDPDRWFDNVEKAMILLSKPKYYRRAEHGFVRGIEPVSYVRDIRELYVAYRSVLGS